MAKNEIRESDANWLAGRLRNVWQKGARGTVIKPHEMALDVLNNLYGYGEREDPVSDAKPERKQ